MTPVYFASAQDFHKWLEAHHAATDELLVGFYKKASGKGGLSYAEAVDELLCFGWIDGVVKRMDAARYTHRITPRRPGSIWSNVNVAHVQRLTLAGKMHPAGTKAFENRAKHKSGIYSYEQPQSKPRPQVFPAALGKILRASKPAWRFWQSQPPGYQRTVVAWVTGAKQETTRRTRLIRLIKASEHGRRL